MENLTNRITTKEAARLLGISDGRVRQMILNGQLSAKRFGRALPLSDFKRAAEIGGGLFDGLAEQVRRWRDQNETLEVERWARLGL